MYERHCVVEGLKDSTSSTILIAIAVCVYITNKSLTIVLQYIHMTILKNLVCVYSFTIL